MGVTSTTHSSRAAGNQCCPCSAVELTEQGCSTTLPQEFRTTPGNLSQAKITWLTTVASGLCDIPYTFLMSATGLWTLQKKINKINQVVYFNHQLCSFFPCFEWETGDTVQVSTVRTPPPKNTPLFHAVYKWTSCLQSCSCKLDFKLESKTITL